MDILMGFFKWISKIFADWGLEREKRKSQQQVESYKAELKKEEFLYPKKFEAASQFVALHSDLQPRYRYPEMIWDDACEDFAFGFKEVEERLEQYKATYGAVLPPETFDRLSRAITDASLGKFEVSRDDVSSEGIDLADAVMQELEEIEKELREAVRPQLDEQKEPARQSPQGIKGT